MRRTSFNDGHGEGEPFPSAYKLYKSDGGWQNVLLFFFSTPLVICVYRNVPTRGEKRQVVMFRPLRLIKTQNAICESTPEI